jgi:hypothetical protein
MSDMTDNELKVAVMKADLLLKQRQHFWEVPKGIATVAAAMAVFLGFVLAASAWIHPAPQQITATIRFDQPLAVKVVP